MNRRRTASRRGGPRVLWGRIGTLVLGVGLVFLLGRCSVEPGVPPEELAAAQGRIAELETQNRNLEEAQAAQAAGGIDTSPAEGAEPPAEDAPEAEPAGAPSPATAGDVYTVQDQDTLESIAEAVYGDRSLWRMIAEANEGVDATSLRVGQELRLPPKPDQG